MAENAKKFNNLPAQIWVKEIPTRKIDNKTTTFEPIVNLFFLTNNLALTCLLVLIKRIYLFFIINETSIHRNLILSSSSIYSGAKGQELLNFKKRCVLILVYSVKNKNAFVDNEVKLRKNSFFLTFFCHKIENNVQRRVTSSIVSYFIKMCQLVLSGIEARSENNWRKVNNILLLKN